MGNSRHGGRKFRSIADAVNRRNTSGVLNARRESEADIRQALYVGPDGRGYDQIQDQSTGEISSVRDLSGGLTMKPGSQVPIASFSGSHAEFRIGAPPGGGSKFGAPPRGYRPYGTVTPAVESAVANEYAFGNRSSDGALVAMLYADGTYLSERAADVSIQIGASGCILTDTSETVGDGSAILFDFDGQAHGVWDVEGTTSYSYSAPSGWILPSPAYFYNESLYWIELEEVTGADGDMTERDFRLRVADPDLDNVATIATITLDATDYDAATTHFDDDGRDSAFLSVDTDGVVAYVNMRPVDDNHEVLVWTNEQYRFLISTGSEVVRQIGGGLETTGGLVENSSLLFQSMFSGTKSGTSFLVAVQVSSDIYVGAKTDDASSALATYWPSISSRLIRSANMGLDGTTFQVYAFGDDATWLYRGTSSGVSVGGAVDPFDDTTPPDTMFYFGEE